jgi:hypothetical protein
MRRCNCGYVSKNEYDHDSHIYNCQEYKKLNRKLLKFIILFIIVLVIFILAISPHIICYNSAFAGWTCKVI